MHPKGYIFRPNDVLAFGMQLKKIIIIIIIIIIRDLSRNSSTKLFFFFAAVDNIHHLNKGGRKTREFSVNVCNVT